MMVARKPEVENDWQEAGVKMEYSKNSILIYAVGEMPEEEESGQHGLSVRLRVSRRATARRWIEPMMVSSAMLSDVYGVSASRVEVISSFSRL